MKQWWNQCINIEKVSHSKNMKSLTSVIQRARILLFLEFFVNQDKSNTIFFNSRMPRKVDNVDSLPQAKRYFQLTLKIIYFLNQQEMKQK